MSPARRRADPMTRDELLAKGLTVSVADAARALGIGATLAREMIAGKRDTPFPARTYRLGDRTVVVTADLIRVLGLDPDALPAAPPTDTPGAPGAPQ